MKIKIILIIKNLSNIFFYFETHRKVQNILRQVASKLTKKMEIRNSMTPEELETDKKTISVVVQ